MTEEHRNEYQTRIAKVQELKDAWIPPYANEFQKQFSLQELIDKSTWYNLPPAELLLSEWSDNTYTTAWRLMMFRTHGKLSFGTLRDHSADLQIAFVKDLCKLDTWNSLKEVIEIGGSSLSAYKFADKYIDVGDFIWVRGELFVTKHWELTLFVNEFKLLSKAVRPLWDKRHGVKDEEKLYRQRYLDMTMNPESYERFLFKSKFYDALRTFYKQEWFQEIVTSILWNAASGAAAKPFTTHHNDFDLDVFLRIAFEPALKMATVGRYEKVFEIGKDFRNEWSDPSHIQEFTQVEHYAAYRNYLDNMNFTERLFDFLFQTLDLPKVLAIKDKNGESKDVDRSTPWERIDYIEGVKKASGWLDITQYGMDDAEQLRKDIKQLGHEWVWMDEQWTTTLIDYLYKKILRPTITGPAFVYNYPKTMQPLARQSDSNPEIVEQFQVVVNWREIIKAYSELVDPIIQKENFDVQQTALAQWDEEATSWDDEFLLAMEHGMPPQSGFGMWLERILALLTGQDNIRDVVMFPLMKPHWKHDVLDHPSMPIEKNVSHEKTDIDPITNTTESTPAIQLPSTDQVTWLIDSYLHETKRHCEQVWWIMKRFAESLWLDEDEQQRRWIAWILHDVDRDHIGKDPAEHLWGQFENIVNEIELHHDIIEDIRSHYTEKTWVPINTQLRKYLAAVDELSWFIHAYALMRPTWLEWMKAKSVKKKIKDKSFAAWVNREHLRYCETYLNISLDEFVPQIIEAMQSLS